MSRYRKKTSFFTVIFSLLLIVLFAGGVVFVYRYTNGFKDKFTAFSVEYDGKTVTDNVAGISLPPDTESRFDVKQAFGFLDNAQKGYTVEIVPHGEFDFFIDGKAYAFSGESEGAAAVTAAAVLFEAFDVKLHEDHFTVKLPKDMSVKNVLERIYSGMSVKMPDHLPDGKYAVINVVSADGENSVKIGVILRGNSFDIALNETGVVF